MSWSGGYSDSAASQGYGGYGNTSTGYGTGGYGYGGYGGSTFSGGYSDSAASAGYGGYGNTSTGYGTGGYSSPYGGYSNSTGAFGGHGNGFGFGFGGDTSPSGSAYGSHGAVSGDLGGISNAGFGLSTGPAPAGLDGLGAFGGFGFNTTAGVKDDPRGSAFSMGSYSPESSRNKSAFSFNGSPAAAMSGSIPGIAGIGMDYSGLSSPSNPRSLVAFAGATPNNPTAMDGWGSYMPANAPDNVMALAADPTVNDFRPNAVLAQGTLHAVKPSIAAELPGLTPQAQQDFATAQRLFGAPVNIVSAYRSPAVNKAAAGAQNSQHIQGKAIDADTSGMSVAQKQAFVAAAAQAGFQGFGLYGQGAFGNNVHVDLGPARAWGGFSPAGGSAALSSQAMANYGAAMHGISPDGTGGSYNPSSDIAAAGAAMSGYSPQSGMDLTYNGSAGVPASGSAFASTGYAPSSTLTASDVAINAPIAGITDNRMVDQVTARLQADYDMYGPAVTGLGFNTYKNYIANIQAPAGTQVAGPSYGAPRGSSPVDTIGAEHPAMQPAPPSYATAAFSADPAASRYDTVFSNPTAAMPADRIMSRYMAAPQAAMPADRVSSRYDGLASPTTSFPADSLAGRYGVPDGTVTNLGQPMQSPSAFAADRMAERYGPPSSPDAAFAADRLSQRYGVPDGTVTNLGQDPIANALATSRMRTAPTAVAAFGGFPSDPVASRYAPTGFEPVAAGTTPAFSADPAAQRYADTAAQPTMASPTSLAAGLDSTVPSTATAPATGLPQIDANAIPSQGLTDLKSGIASVNADIAKATSLRDKAEKLGQSYDALDAANQGLATLDAAAKKISQLANNQNLSPEQAAAVQAAAAQIAADQRAMVAALNQTGSLGIPSPDMANLGRLSKDATAQTAAAMTGLTPHLAMANTAFGPAVPSNISANPVQSAASSVPSMAPSTAAFGGFPADPAASRYAMSGFEQPPALSAPAGPEQTRRPPSFAPPTVTVPAPSSPNNMISSNQPGIYNDPSMASVNGPGVDPNQLVPPPTIYAVADRPNPVAEGSPAFTPATDATSVSGHGQGGSSAFVPETQTAAADGSSMDAAFLANRQTQPAVDTTQAAPTTVKAIDPYLASIQQSNMLKSLLNTLSRSKKSKGHANA